MDKIKAHKLLPKYLIVEDLNNIFYRIGLNFTSFRLQYPRKRFNKPIIVFTILHLFIIEKLLVILFNDNQFIHIVLGDFVYFYGVPIYWCLGLILWTNITINTQLISYYVYRNGIILKFMTIFEMLSGLRSPQSIGLTNPIEIEKFSKQSKLMFQIIYRNNTYLMPFLSGIPGFVMYLLNTSLYNSLVYGIPNAILFYLWGYYAWNLLLY